MASFVYNSFKSNAAFDIQESQNQWYDYIQKKEFHDDLKNSLKSEGELYRKDLQRNAELASKDMNALRKEFSQASEDQLEAIYEQTRAITESAEMVCGRLDEGFDEVSGKLDDICAMLDWRLTAVEDQLRISNLLLQNIGLLLRVPDFQKERQYFIEQGFKHYRNAMLDSDIYEDALKNLLEAENRETTDYVVLHRIGMIYLYANNEEILNLVKAEEYFRRAAKYAMVESNPEAQQTLNLLAGDTEQNLLNQAITPEAAKAVAAKAYFQAGVACYVQGNFKEAEELSYKAFSLLPSFYEAGFIQAKAVAQLGRGKKSAEILRGIIKDERFYSIKTLSDTDLITKLEVRMMLEHLTNETIDFVTQKIAKIKQDMLPNSQITPLLPEIESLVSRNTYLDTLNALDAINIKKEWKRPKLHAAKINWVIDEELISIEDFVKVEKQYHDEEAQLEQKMDDYSKHQIEKAANRELAKHKLNREFANRVITNFLKLIPIRIFYTLLLAFIAGLIFGSFVFLGVIGISLFILVIQFISVLLEYKKQLNAD